MTRTDFINTHRATRTVLVYKFPDTFRVTAKSKHVIAGEVLTIGKRAYPLDGYTVALKA
jgi:hypothetical protein